MTFPWILIYSLGIKSLSKNTLKKKETNYRQMSLQNSLIDRTFDTKFYLQINGEDGTHCN